MEIPGFITVRTSSTRLPGKCLLPFGEGNVLEHIIKRSIFYGLTPIVCTTIEQSDDILQEIADKENVKCFRGSVQNKLKRWLDCCDHFGIKQFHTIDADDPFFDGEEMIRSFSLLNKGYDMVCPTKTSSGGSASVGYSLTRDVIHKACKSLDENSDTEMMWYYVEKVKGLKKTILQESVTNPKIVRLTLDYEEDYWLLQTVRRILGNLATRNEVDQLFLNNPDLYKVNWFHNEEWKSGQLAKKI
jgi:spore coat polysaccharide biosynthesis protein SpsF